MPLFYRTLIVGLLTSLAQLSSAAETDAPPTPAPPAFWIDQQHANIQDQLKTQANRMDGWFGEAPSGDARAKVRLIMDNSWDKHHELDTKVRIRGSVRLPNADKRFRLMFGDDTLEDEQPIGIPLSSTESTSTTPTDALNRRQQINQQARRDNASIAIRWLANISEQIQADFDLGVRSGTDIYARAEMARSWQHDEQISSTLRQTLRYGARSDLYARTDFDLRYQVEDQPLLRYYVEWIYAKPDKALGFSWAHRFSREHSFFKDHAFSYGLLVTGHLKDEDLQRQAYGPWLTWRQSAFRDWLFVRGDLNYLDNRTEKRSHYLSALVRLEAVF
ncbi:MAG: hypothetical protein VXW65_05495 [Pseudomonadota bacterium]|nr:hypothetical protein [Pseudomonadota bacterium]